MRARIVIVLQQAVLFVAKCDRATNSLPVEPLNDSLMQCTLYVVEALRPEMLSKAWLWLVAAENRCFVMSCELNGLVRKAPQCTIPSLPAIITTVTVNAFLG
jgi:hypothetical protein